MIDLDREHLRKTYQLCRTGFFILAASLVPTCIITLLAMVGLLGDWGLFQRVVKSPWHDWTSTLCAWGSLVGTMLLWGRWEHQSWHRRTGFLLLMSLVDMVLWFMEQGEGEAQGQFSWFRHNLGQALGWAEFALLASLSGDYLVHLGLDHAEDSAKSTRSLAATGAVIWMLQFCESTNWDAGWPLQPRVIGPHGWLLFLGAQLIWTITLIQVTALIIAAFRQSNRTLEQMAREDQDHDLLRSPSESASHDLLAPLPSAANGQES
jgi:hypothetical protein